MNQSVWNPASLIAGEIKDLSWILIIICSIVVIITIALLLIALKNNKHLNPGNRFILWTGIYLPTIVLLGMLFMSLKSSVNISRINKMRPDINIKITAHQFWWEVEYPEYKIITANEIHIPVGALVKFELKSKDVIHSFWIPNIHGKTDMLPDHNTFLSVKVIKEGVYRGQCAEFCGLQHALMAFPVIALSENKFKQWLREHQEFKESNPSQSEIKGKEIYLRESCHTCHSISGTEFIGKSGPDLTYLGKRLTLGAGTIPNNRKNLARWIQDSQTIKPMNRMPAYKSLKKEDLNHLLDYLESLN